MLHLEDHILERSKSIYNQYFDIDYINTSYINSLYHIHLLSYFGILLNLYSSLFLLSSRILLRVKTNLIDVFLECAKKFVTLK